MRKRHLNATPFKLHGQTMIRLDRDAEKPRSRRLEWDEEARLMKHMERDPFLKDIIVALLATGCRPGELLSLQPSQIRRDRQGVIAEIVLTDEKTKTRRTRVLPVTDELREILERRMKGPDGQFLGPGCYVFGTPTGERRKCFKESWKATLAAAGIIDLQVRDLRRTFGSQLLESGAEVHEVRDQLGHTDIKQTNTYLATMVGGRRHAIEKLSDYRKKAKTPQGRTA